MCPNCSAAVAGQYCAHCGQHQSSLQISIADLLREHLQDAFNLEGRLFRTLRIVATRPGYLTRDYLAGRRASYTHPVRLYLAVSALYFATYLLTRSIDRTFFGYSGASNPGYASAMARGLLLSVPVLALAMKVLYSRRKWHLVEHVVFLFHVGAAGLLAAWVSLLLATAYKLAWKDVMSAPVNPGYFHLAAFAAFCVYFVLSLRGAYAESLLRSLWKGVLLLVLLVALVASVPSLLRWLS